MAPFWRNGAKTPGVDEWVAVLGDEPILILLDELPSYLQMAQGEPVGETTLGDLTIGALERLFNALPRCPRACVVVTNLKDDVYLDGSGQLRTLIESLTKHYDRNAQAITPVQQNTGEVFAIVRKRLFDGLPSAGPHRRGRAGLCGRAPEGEARRHDPVDAGDLHRAHPRDLSVPSVHSRHCRSLRRKPRLPEDARTDPPAAAGRARRPRARTTTPFLIGLQHLDFNDQATLEEIRKINPAYANAISRDVADRGNALAERIDAGRREPDRIGRGQGPAHVVAVAAETPLRGLTDGELIETLVDPLARSVGDQGRAQPSARPGVVSVPGRRPARLLRSDRERHGRDHRDRRRTSPTSRSTRRCATSCRRSSSRAVGSLYSDRMAILPALDEIQLDDDRPTLIILERPADKLPQDFVDWWNKQDLQNRVLVLTADPNAVTTLRTERPANARDRQGRGADPGAARPGIAADGGTRRRARSRGGRLHQRAPRDLQDHRLPDDEDAAPGLAITEERRVEVGVWRPTGRDDAISSWSLSLTSGALFAFCSNGQEPPPARLPLSGRALRLSEIALGSGAIGSPYWPSGSERTRLFGDVLEAISLNKPACGTRRSILVAAAKPTCPIC